MKRSEINAAIAHSMALIEKYGIKLPFFAYMKHSDWLRDTDKYSDIRALMLGWDVTDFGAGDFINSGAVLFTARNGSPDGKRGTPYAEKYMVFSGESGQYIPLHCHVAKTEDIINRAGGVLSVTLYGSRPDEKYVWALDEKAEVSYMSDGILHTVAAGTVIDIQNGDSITLTPGVFHKLGAKRGCGDLIAGEVSSVNDDRVDNVFYEKTDRFCHIDEDEDAVYPLCSDIM
ncbi:MAG: D-lyxose/D-mannose family sugar isomerase [Eubacteriales bacterium]